jgi:hypothetical protein
MLAATDTKYPGFVKPDSSTSCSQELASGNYPKSGEYGAQLPAILV